MEVKLKDVRLAFPAIFEPKQVAGEGEPRYSAAFPIVPGSPNGKALEDAITAVAKEKWKDKAAGVLDELRAKDKVAFRRSALSKDGKVYDGFEGMHTLNAGGTSRPTVVDRDRSPLTSKDGRPYAGCYVNAIVDVWAQDNKYGRRINCTLKGLQFNRDGDAFSGGAPASADDFDDVSEGSDAADLAG